MASIVFDELTSAAPISAVKTVVEGIFNFGFNGEYGQDQVDSEAALAAGSPARLTGNKPSCVLEWTDEAVPDANTDWKQIATVYDNGQVLKVDIEAGTCRTRVGGEADAGTSMFPRLDA